MIGVTSPVIAFAQRAGASLKATTVSIPVLWRAVALGTGLFLVLWVLPNVLNRFSPDVYALQFALPKVVNGALFSSERVIYTYSNLLAVLLGTIPSFFIWMWFPGQRDRLEKGLKALKRQSEDSILKEPPPNIFRWQYFWVFASIVIVIEVFFSIQIGRDGTTEWFEAMDPVGWMLAGAYGGVPLLLAFLTLFRVVIVLRWLARALSDDDVKLRPLSSDQCAGLAFLGGFCGRMTAYAVVEGFWMVSITVHVAIVSQGSIRPNEWTGEILGLALSFYVLYGILVWAVLAYPTLKAHSVMLRHRNHRLDGLDDRYDNAMDSSDLPAEERLRELQLIREQRDLLKGYPVWPFTPLRLKGIGLLAAAPPVLGLASSASQLTS